MKKLLKLFVLVLTFALALWSCASNENNSGKQHGTSDSKNGEPSLNEVIAKVGENELKRGDFENVFDVYKKSSIEDENFYSEEHQGMVLMDLLREKMFRDYVLGMAAEEYFKSNGMAIEKTKLDEKYKVFLDSVKDDEVIQNFIKNTKNAEDLIKRQLLNEYYFAMLEKTVDERERPKYSLTETQFKNTRLTVSAAHILVGTKEEAETLLKTLGEGGDFEKLAKEKSVDSASAVRGGKLSTIGFSDMPVEFSEIAFSLPKDKLSKPVKTVFGYHIIKVLDFETVGDAMQDKATTETQIGELKEELYQRHFLINLHEEEEKLLSGANVEVLGGPKRVDGKEE